MWTSQIVNKTKNKGVVTVDVLYTDGANSITESIDMTGGSMDVLNRKVAGKISTLTANDNLISQIPSGSFTAVVTPSPQENFIAALRRCQSCQRAVDLNLISKNDKVYVDALANLKSLYNESFIDLL